MIKHRLPSKVIDDEDVVSQITSIINEESPPCTPLTNDSGKSWLQ